MVVERAEKELYRNRRKDAPPVSTKSRSNYSLPDLFSPIIRSPCTRIQGPPKRTLSRTPLSLTSAATSTLSAPGCSQIPRIPNASASLTTSSYGEHVSWASS